MKEDGNTNSQKQLPIIKPLNITSSQKDNIKKYKLIGNKGNLSFGFENTFRKRKRELNNSQNRKEQSEELHQDKPKKNVK